MQQWLDDLRELSRKLTPQPTGIPPVLPTLHGIRAVVFDIYGTLMISGSGDIGAHEAQNNEAALTASLAACGVSGDLQRAGHNGVELFVEAIHSAHNHARANAIDFPEIDIRAIWSDAIGLLQDSRIITLPGTPTDFDIERLAIQYEARTNPVWPMPFLHETLSALKSRGLSLGIVSNAQFYTPLLFPALLHATLDDYGFDPGCSIWSYEQHRGKPSPELYTILVSELMKRHGIHAQETLYIGNDMLKDIWAASQADLRTALYAGDARSLRLRENDARARSIQPDAIITDLRQLMVLLGLPM